jgi:hypothetical protein
MNKIIFPDAKKIAKDKINEEVKTFKGNNKASAVYRHVADMLKNFTDQELEFAEAVQQSKATLSGCCKTIMQNVGSSVSDIEVYKKAVQFYFPGADIKLTMKIKLNPYEDDAEEVTPKKTKTLDISLDDLFDI